MAKVTVVRGDGLLAIGSFVIAVVTTETAGGFFVADVVRIGAPIGFHFREQVRFENCVRR